MSKEIELTPGYNPDKYRDEICERMQKIRKSMTDKEFLDYVNRYGCKDNLYKRITEYNNKQGE